MSLSFDRSDVDRFRQHFQQAAHVNRFLSDEMLVRLSAVGVKRVFASINHDCCFQVEFDCEEHQAVEIVASLAMPSVQIGELEFVRPSLWDVRAYLKVPVNCFIECASIEAMPMVDFLCPKPMTVSPACFKLFHWKHRYKRKARLEFNHPTLRDWNSHAASTKEFPMEATRQEMWDDLFGRMEDEIEKHKCYISTEPVVVEIHKSLLKQKSKQTV